MEGGNRILFNLFINGKFKDFYFFLKNGHPPSPIEEVIIKFDIISDESYKWLSHSEIDLLIRFRIIEMYRKKHPNAKKWLILKK